MNKALSKYFKILKGEKKPKFKEISKKILEKKIEDAFKILKNCCLCERKCMVNRMEGGYGWCKVGNKMIVSSAFVHLGEEAFFVPSFTVFFWSCTFNCVFCQNWPISQRFEKGKIMSEEELAIEINNHSYCKNVNFVGGDPTPQLPFILKTLKYVKTNIPTIWNSNFYMSKKSMDLLSGTIDVYLSDFKYGNDECARRLSGVQNYMKIVKRNHLLAFKDSELVIRHLLLPNHIDCCTKPIFDFISKAFRDKVIVNIMDQYRPEYKALNFPEIARRISLKEKMEAIDYAKGLGLNFIT